MTVFVNGRFVPDSRAVVSAFDRGFLYGDGLFETIRIHRGRPFLLDRHLARLAAGAAFLQIPLAFTQGEIERVVVELLARNRAREAVLRLNLSRGSGPRGYSMRGAIHPTFIASVHPGVAPSEAKPCRWHLVTASVRVATGDSLSRFKTTNKLAHVLARAGAGRSGADEALMLNTAGQVAEAASANVFLVRGNRVATPSLASGALPGVTRGLVLELCRALRIEARETTVRPSDIARVDAVFLTLSSLGIVECASFDGRTFLLSPVVGRLWTAYVDALNRV